MWREERGKICKGRADPKTKESWVLWSRGQPAAGRGEWKAAGKKEGLQGRVECSRQ